MSEVKKLITASDRSTKALSVAIAGLGKVASDLSSLGDITVKLADEIEFKQSQLDHLNVEFDNKFREATAELRLRVKEDSRAVLDELLAHFNMGAISASDLSALHNQVITLTSDYTSELADAESAGFRKGAAEFQTKLKDAEANHRIAIAELNAKSNAKDDKIQLLEEQLKEAREQNTAERETRLAIAQAESQRQGVVVNTSK